MRKPRPTVASAICAMYRSYVMRRAERRARLAARSPIGLWSGCRTYASRCDISRRHRRSPRSPCITLALGIGANTAIFSVVHRLLIAPLPYANGDRVVALKTIGQVRGRRRTRGDHGRRMRRAIRPRPLARMGGARAFVRAGRGRGADVPLALAGLAAGHGEHAFMTANLLGLLGARPSLGRMFTPAEEKPVTNHVAMISHRWWQSRVRRTR